MADSSKSLIPARWNCGVTCRGGGNYDDYVRPDNRPRRRETPSNIVGSVIHGSIPSIATGALRIMLGVTVGLYILNQQHMLPRELSSVVSKVLFWPTLPITVARRFGTWFTAMDETVIIGGAPFGFLNYPEKLFQEYNVRGVVNFCEEYRGPVRKYEDLGIQHLHLPTTDHFEPSEEDLIRAVSFIRKHQAQGKRVYVHCRAGHGRSAAAVFLWMLCKDPIVDLQKLNQEMCTLRNVRKNLWQQYNIQKLHSRLLRTGKLTKRGNEGNGRTDPTSDSDDDDFYDEEEGI